MHACIYTVRTYCAGEYLSSSVISGRNQGTDENLAAFHYNPQFLYDFKYARSESQLEDCVGNA
jgi:hypothetical protein